MSHWLSYLFPQKLAEYSTKYNNYIRVNDEYGEKKLLVNGSQQSGKYIRNLWKRSFKSFGISNDRTWNSILVLGVGGGNVIDVLHVQFPNARITAVDIDPVIIDIAKKYFLTGDSTYINFITADAKQFVQENNSKFDCIVIDIFIGIAVPDFVKSESFVMDCKQLLSSSGALCINYLQDREYGVKSDEFIVTLRNIFSHVYDFRKANNRFFFASIV